MGRNTMTALKKLGYLSLATFVLAFVPGDRSPGDAPHTYSADARTAVEWYYDQWRDLLERRAAIGEGGFIAQFLALVQDAFDADHLAAEVLRSAGAPVRPYERERLASALEIAIKNEIVSGLAEVGKVPTMRVTTADEQADRATIECSVRAGSETYGLTLYMAKTADGQWKIRDLHTGNERITARYGRDAKRMLDKYSFPYVVAQVSDAPFVVLEDFEEGTVDELPVGWQWKGKDDDKHKPYRVHQEGDNKYLAARDTGQSVIIAKDVKWNLQEFPYVSFRWRVHEIPEGADERRHDKVDSAAGIYFVYRRILGLVPESVKYVWSSTLPVGAAMQRSGLGKPWMVVADSGKAGLGEWRTHVFDITQAYRDTFGGLPSKEAVGIAILSDANNTPGGHAYADYDDIRALRSADSTVQSGVRVILQAQ